MGELAERRLKQNWYEKEPFGAFWEKGYRDGDASTMGGPSHEIIEIAPAYRPAHVLLDLGCGEGRNSVYLAGLGFDVTAIDRSTNGIEKLRNIARHIGLSITTFVADIATIEITDDYDLVMAHGVLYYLTNLEWRELLSQVKIHTPRMGSMCTPSSSSATSIPNQENFVRLDIPIHLHLMNYGSSTRVGRSCVRTST